MSQNQATSPNPNGTFALSPLPFDQIGALSRILSSAYPGAKLTPELYAERIEKRWDDDKMKFYGIYDAINDSPDIAFTPELLVGGMRYHDFEMNLLGQPIRACGIGSVAVKLDRKKEKIAYHILNHYLTTYRAKRCPMAILYPFQPGFYKRMGFGYGAPQYQYRLDPLQLPNHGDKSHVHLLEAIHAPLLLDFYNRMALKNNGLLQKQLRDMETLLLEPTLHVVGRFNEGHLTGYILCRFESDATNFLINDLSISQWLYDSPECFNDLCTYLNSQKDQIRHILIHTQETNFHMSLMDARDTSSQLLSGIFHAVSRQGIGVMYRVLHVEALITSLSEYCFGNFDFTFTLHIKDDFLTDNEAYYTLQLIGGYLRLLEKSDEPCESAVVLSLDISDFSSLITCSTDLRSLVRYGKATLTDASWLNPLHQIFSTDVPPLCMTGF